MDKENANPNEENEDVVDPKTEETPAVVETPVSESEPKQEEQKIPPLKDQKTIVALKTAGYTPTKIEPTTVIRNGEEKIEVLVHFPNEAFDFYRNYIRGSREGILGVIFDHDASYSWWRSIVHSKHTL